MKYTKKIYRRGRNQGKTRKTAIRPQKKKEEALASRADLTAIRRGRAAIKRGEYVTLDELTKDKKALAKEAKRQSRILRDDPQEKEILEAWEKTADRTGWKC